MQHGQNLPHRPTRTSAEEGSKQCPEGRSKPPCLQRMEAWRDADFTPKPESRT
jgi:hypothetical protein